MVRIGLFCLTVIFTVFLSSCQEPKDLEFRDFKNLRLSNISFEKATLTSDVVLYNPNRFSLELARTDLDIFVENNLLGHSSQNIQVKIPNRQEFTLPLVMEIDIKNLLKNGYLGMTNKELPIRALGTVKIGKMGVYKNFKVDYTTMQNISSYFK